MPEPRQEVQQGILRGMYRFQQSGLKRPKARVQLLGSGTILNEVIEAARLLEGYGVAADVWSVTSYKALYLNAIETARTNRLNPGQPAQLCYAAQVLNPTRGPIVAASDYLKALPELLSGHLNRPIQALGTDGFGRSESREALRDFFEVDCNHITLAALSALVADGQFEASVAQQAMQTLGIDPERPQPHYR